MDTFFTSQAANSTLIRLYMCDVSGGEISTLNALEIDAERRDSDGQFRKKEGLP